MTKGLERILEGVESLGLNIPGQTVAVGLEDGVMILTYGSEQEPGVELQAFACHSYARVPGVKFAEVQEDAVVGATAGVISEASEPECIGDCKRCTLDVCLHG